MSVAEDMFDQMAGANGSNSGVFFTTGIYKVGLKEIDYKPNGYKGKSCTFRFEVKESNNPDHPVGSTRVWITKLDKSRDENTRTMADIKSCIFALLGKNPRDIGPAEKNPKAHEQATSIFMAAIDPEYAKKKEVSPVLLIGKETKLEAMSIKTRPKPGQTEGGDFTRHVWG